ncbi:short-chain dehydrogenase/reductase [Xylaria bambusicola]|uniref:short-chain dehydrogenase/reductase n=1 Tax=Xylaria bambusicola TaxID=326684 RepID=UPI00200759ED|nr:short-chain dehydrogenase/reductase [Xylaria bambusicola]KAI0506079.1 short-chain dehydrogenase/reductase [Xylaria bambusicola]
MVDFQTMASSNSRLSSVKGPIIALFVGATSGIGLGVLREFARQAVNPHIYFVARNPTKAGPIADELRLINPHAKCEIIHRDVSLIKDSEKVAEEVMAQESSLDLLFMSQGFVSLDGRQDTSEGLDASISTRYYSRIRIAQLLLPLLNNSQSPRVVSVLAGGKEGPIDEHDLALDKPGNFSMSAASYHSCTMNTLMLERLASEYPRVSFIHAYPGFVDTPLFDGVSSGIQGKLLSYTLVPVARLFARSISDAGSWGLFAATSARYSVDDGMVPLTRGIEKAEKTKGGIFLVNEKGESTDNENVLGPFRQRGVDEKIWVHTKEVFANIM